MKILFTGDYDQKYNRTKVILDGLSTMPEVEIFHYPFRARKKFNKEELVQHINNADFIYMPSFTHNEVPVVRKLTNKKIVFDPLISRYLTKVFDYKLVWKYSPRAFKNFRKDKKAMQLANHIFADTLAHKNYFVDTFSIDAHKISVLPIGISLSDFSPLPKDESSEFVLGFYGGFIPLQGVSQILETALLLKNHTDIKFQLIGNGFQFEEMKQLAQKYSLTNVSFLGWIASEELPHYIAQWDVCLGIFGNTLKSDLVIPNKIYHYAAMQKPIITKESKGIQELLTHNENVFLTKNFPQYISKAILELKNNTELRTAIANNAHAFMSKELNEREIATKFLESTSAL